MDQDRRDHEENEQIQEWMAMTDEDMAIWYHLYARLNQKNADALQMTFQLAVYDC